MTDLETRLETLRGRLGDRAPRLAIVLGSGLGALTDRLTDAVTVPFSDLPGFPVSAVSGHQGALVFGTLGGTQVAVVSGRVHYYEHGDPGGMRAPLETLSALGCDTLALSNAAGSLNDDMPPGSLMALHDHINWSGLNPLIGVQTDRRFVDMTNAYDPDLRARFEACAKDLGLSIHAGTYAWYSGPSFETPAEIRALRLLGADAVGMSTVPEAILARFFGMRVAAVSVITNFAAGMQGAAIGHDHTKAEAARAQASFCDLFEAFARGQGEQD